jgi:predicted amidohydrolase
MRVALVQLAQDPKGRASNLQAISAAIDRTARENPAPDMIVLPGACDTGGARASSIVTEACLQSVAETIAWKAREWGVFIAAGLHVHSGETFVPCAVVFDADGDIVARSRYATGTDGTATDAPTALWHSALGDIGVAGRPPEVPDAGDTLAGEQGAFVAWPVTAPTAKERRLCDVGAAALGKGLSVTRGAYWGVVTAAHSWSRDDHRRTFVCNPEGKIMAYADSEGETIVFAEISLTAATARASLDAGSCGHHAD